jgi:phosphatidylethanolamine-binding protein (PEBP) family uncharacterized protein
MRLAASTLALTVLLAVAGCGGGSATTASQPASVATSASGSTSSSSPATSSTSTSAAPSPTPTSTDPNASSTSPPGTPALIHLSSAALHGNPEVASPISARYTCAGANVSLPLTWGLLPHGTKEVGVFVMHHVQKGRLAADWGVLGLKPTVKGLPTGRVPAGAVVGRNSAGQERYAVCPPKGKEVEYGVFVYAFSHALHPRPGFNAVAVFERALAGSLGQGLIGFTFKR